MSTQANRAIHKPQFIRGDALQIPTYKVLKQDGNLYKNAQMPDIDEALAQRIYRAMARTRMLDERGLASQRQGRLSFYMQSTGEEAVTVGFAAALDDQDMIMAQYREQGALVYRGFTLDEFMNQLFSNAKDHGKGRQMPIHYGSSELHYMTISSPLATQIPQATGYAYGQKMAGDGHCTVAVFGEGAASEGDFHAALNMASVLKVPVIFLCRNNGYAISTPSSEQFAGDGIAPRALGYGMHTIRIDGNDILAVLEATREARKIAVEQNEPVLIEAMSYRLAAHSSSDDPSGYRSKKEEAKWRDKDPLERMKNWMIQQDWWSEEQDKELFEAERQLVMAAMKKAEKVPAPHPDEMITDVYDTPTPHLEQQLAELKGHIQRYPEVYPKAAAALGYKEGE
ncbi:thiamine pyrophosphate-dependent dehydrogenase E1 component subunit alpha [Motiliproteus coralliicola]|uniref:2-oxoisovalerate dehydrogenase subunit alpha n=1 Tax=Motiliproteus coralliicola TaxID=2283196 RepID=A0A369WMR5_9GAMM|nr:thiamine pyrophosphate-dependent dehydrogenase E1 component subunit alpha [Motiliproteus coralliicola]RDE22503.1 thiamine pyrophosphate-dependent dehydrogenase E1 component subunit alpha [Motiliproteus coralliicola]